MKIYNFDEEGLGAHLVLNGSLFVQWAIVVWILIVLNEYLDPVLGFGPLRSLLRW